MVASKSATDRLKRRLLGNPLPRDQEEARTVPSFQALPILSSDALSSVAYATDAALGVLILAGSGALSFSLPITISIVALIAIVVFSYRQTITAYPQGGGAYVVGRANLGTLASLVAAASLLIDYVLTAAVSLMAGTQALSSLWPWLLNWQVLIALVLLVLVGWANLRGVGEAGRLFALPTYSFVVMVGVLALAGLQNLIVSHGFTPDPPPLVKAIEPLGLFLILRAFSSGCSAMTGIEAIANGVSVFREPAARRARATMLVMGLMLAAMFLAVSGLAWNLGVTLLLAPRLLPADWFERAVIEFGQATGVAASGLLLLRMADPDDHSQALPAFSLKQLMLQPFLAGGVVTVVAPLAVVGWGLPTWTGFCFGLVVLAGGTGLLLPQLGKRPV